MLIAEQIKTLEELGFIHHPHQMTCRKNYGLEQYIEVYHFDGYVNFRCFVRLDNLEAKHDLAVLREKGIV